MSLSLVNIFLAFPEEILCERSAEHVKDGNSDKPSIVTDLD